MLLKLAGFGFGRRILFLRTSLIHNADADAVLNHYYIINKCDNRD